MQKPLLFISHISEEKEIAQGLKKLVDASFLSMIDVFVSSDPKSVSLGRKWLSEITEALKSCAVEVILASPESVKRPWINFECGSGWIRDIPVIPLCHSGMTPAQLPPPLGQLQAATATDEAQLRMVFPGLAEALGCRSPEVDFSEFIETVRGFESTSREIRELKTATPVSDASGLSPHEVATIIEIAERADSPDEGVYVHYLCRCLGEAGFRAIAVKLAIKMLARKDMVETLAIESRHEHEAYMGVRLTDYGWQWLEGNQEKLILKDNPEPSPPDDEVPF